MRRILAGAATVLALSLINAVPAQAHDGHDSTGTGHSSHAGTGANADSSHGNGTTGSGTTTVSSKAPARFYRANLSGRNEVPTPGGPAVGDRDGRGTALVRVQGNRVTFSLEWSGITAPTLGHIHQGVAGANGPVKVMFFGTPMPDTTTAAAGAVTVTDPQIADAIRRNPTGFYVNLHSAAFPGGAIRGQLSPLRSRVDLLAILKGGRERANLSGDQEVPVANGPAVGDTDGRAAAFVHARNTSIDYSLAWVGIAPTLAHIHQGRFGTNGPIKVMFFGSAVPSTIVAISGTVTGVDRAVVAQLRQRPSNFYVNLHTAEFPGGAVRGQLFM